MGADETVVYHRMFQFPHPIHLAHRIDAAKPENPARCGAAGFGQFLDRRFIVHPLPEIGPAFQGGHNDLAHPDLVHPIGEFRGAPTAQIVYQPKLFESRNFGRVRQNVLLQVLSREMVGKAVDRTNSHGQVSFSGIPVNGWLASAI